MLFQELNLMKLIILSIALCNKYYSCPHFIDLGVLGGFVMTLHGTYPKPAEPEPRVLTTILPCEWAMDWDTSPKYGNYK